MVRWLVGWLVVLCALSLVFSQAPRSSRVGWCVRAKFWPERDLRAQGVFMEPARACSCRCLLPCDASNGSPASTMSTAAPGNSSVE